MLFTQMCFFLAGNHWFVWLEHVSKPRLGHIFEGSSEAVKQKTGLGELGLFA